MFFLPLQHNHHNIKMNKKKAPHDPICFSELAREWDFSDKEKVEVEIKRRLKYYGHQYNQSRIDYIRTLRNELYKEISLNVKSKYYNKTNFEYKYSDYSDFDMKKMLTDYKIKYDEINDENLLIIINMAIYWYYLR